MCPLPVRPSAPPKPSARPQATAPRGFTDSLAEQVHTGKRKAVDKLILKINKKIRKDVRKYHDNHVTIKCSQITDELVDDIIKHYCDIGLKSTYATYAGSYTIHITIPQSTSVVA